MSIRTPSEAVAAALATKTNVPDTCQLNTRTWLNAPSAGDRDGDGDADAVDGWLSEPVSARHPGDRHPPIGHPVAWSGGSNGNGHRALVVEYRQGFPFIRSTDAGGRGVCATVPLHWVEDAWGLTYLGWSDTIDGCAIPSDAPKEPVEAPSKPAQQTTGTRVQAIRASLSDALKLMRQAKRRPLVKAQVDDVRDTLKSLPKK